jgi:arylformamidase
MARPPGGWTDATVPLSADLPTWPGDPDVAVEPLARVAEGDPASLSRIEMSTHAGTHVDPPFHFLEDGATVDEMPPEVGLGPARVVAVAGGEVTADGVAAADVDEGERVLLRTRNAEEDWAREPFREDFVHLTTEAAEALAAARPRLVGVDYLSVAGYQRNEEPVHEALLGAGVWILEGLDLSEVEPGPYEMVCLPLRVEGGDGAPARALLRARDGNRGT